MPRHLCSADSGSEERGSTSGSLRGLTGDHRPGRNTIRDFYKIPSTTNKYLPTFANQTAQWKISLHLSRYS